MKRIRLITLLLLCLMLSVMTTNALAAPKAATTKPTLTITVPKGTMRGGVGGDFKISPSVPGFLTVKLLSADGYEIKTLCENMEVHTKANVIEFEALNDDGTPMAEGDYVLSAIMVNQYGNESKETTAKFKIGAPKPTLSDITISSTKKFKLTVSGYVTHASKKGAKISLSLYRNDPQAMYFDDFPEEDADKATNIASTTLDLLEDNPLKTGMGYYTISGVVVEKSPSVSSDPISMDIIIDTDGTAYLLEEAPQEVIDSVNAAIEKLTGKPAVSAAAQSAAKAETEPAETTGEETAETKSGETAASDEGETTTSSSAKYGEGETEMGEDGLEIGAGVSDVAEQTDAGYWTLPEDATDEQIWAAITRPMVSADVAVNESAYIYDSPEEGRKRLGTISGLSQGLNVIKEREDGWSLVEVFRNEDGAFIRGYIRTNKLRIVTPNTTYGIVVDKAAQTLTVYKDGAKIGSCAVSTGLATPKYLHRETPAGEYVLVTRRGTIEYYGNGFSKCTIRFSGNYHLCEIPSTKKNGSDFSLLENSLGEKATRGHICVAHEASSDGGINAEWIWDISDENKNIKLLVLDDKARSEVPVGE